MSDIALNDGASEQRHNRESVLGIQYKYLLAKSNYVTEFRESSSKMRNLFWELNQNQDFLIDEQKIQCLNQKKKKNICKIVVAWEVWDLRSQEYENLSFSGAIWEQVWDEKDGR